VLAEKLQAMGNSVKIVLSDLRVAIFFGEDKAEKLPQYSSIESFGVY